MRIVISVTALLTLLGWSTAHASGFAWIDDSAAPLGVTTGDLVHQPWQLAADREAGDQVMNTTLTVLHKLAKRGLKSRQLATDGASAGFAGTRLRVSNKKLRLQFRFRF